MPTDIVSPANQINLDVETRSQLLPNAEGNQSSVSSIGNAEITGETLQTPLTPPIPNQETFSIAPQRSEASKATSAVEPSIISDETIAPVSTTALEKTTDTKTGEADNKEEEFIERVTAIHKG